LRFGVIKTPTQGETLRFSVPNTQRDRETLGFRVCNTPRRVKRWGFVGSYLRLIDLCITQLKAQVPSRTCNESKEEGKYPPDAHFLESRTRAEVGQRMLV